MRSSLSCLEPSVSGLSVSEAKLTHTQTGHVGCTIMVIIIGVNGGTRHFQYIQPPSHAKYVLKLHQVTQPFGIIPSGTGKISVGFLIMRILAHTGKWHQRFLWALIGITFVNSVTTAIFNFTQCDPIAALWDPALRPTAKCWDPAVNINYGIFEAAWGCAFDVILATLPISIIERDWASSLCSALEFSEE